MKAKKDNAGEKEEQEERSGQTECKVFSEFCNFCFLFSFYFILYMYFAKEALLSET